MILICWYLLGSVCIFDQNMLCCISGILEKNNFDKYFNCIRYRKENGHGREKNYAWQRGDRERSL